MAAESSLTQLLADFQAACESAQQVLPTREALQPPKDGISLLDTKNEIFLAYLQALALRNLNVIRSLKAGSDAETTTRLSEQLTKRLVEHRVYLERGVRPLEQKIKFQVDRVVKAAEDAERAAELEKKAPVKGKGKVEKKKKGVEEDEDEEDSDDDDDSSGSEEDEEELDKTAYRPNLAMMASKSDRSDPAAGRDRKSKSSEDAVYKPPRISATVMPTTGRRERAERKPIRSKTLDEFVSTEYSAAPVAEPSIGSNFAAGGRHNKSARQMKDEQARRDYEEMNLVRLPKQSKKELAKKGYGRQTDGGFGGEEWRDLGSSLDRISDLTRRKGRDLALDKSRKRMAVEDGPRGDGIGNQFDVKKRRMEKKGRR